LFNASMAPNGMMQIWSGLLLRVENEAQLAAVLGHELGHYLRRHVTEQLKDAKSRSAFATLMGSFGLIGMLAQISLLAEGLAFSRNQERDADRIGVHLMRKAGYDVREAAAVWQNLTQELAAAGKGTASPMFATHPPSAERAATLSRLTESEGGGFIGEAEFRRAVDPWLPGLLEDELKRAQYGQTLVLLDRMMKRLPQRADLAYFRGEALRMRGEPGDAQAAMAQLDAAVSLGQEPPQTYRALGYLQKQAGELQLARSAFSRYIERAPDAPDAGLIKSYLQEIAP
jgi:beta-barrel assembly-enhancing protease